MEEDWSDLVEYKQIEHKKRDHYIAIKKDGKITFSQDFIQMSSEYHDDNRDLFTPRIGRETGIRELGETPLGLPEFVSLYYSKVKNAIAFDFWYERHGCPPQWAIRLRSHCQHPDREVQDDDYLYVWNLPFFCSYDLSAQAVQGTYEPKLRKLSENGHKWVIYLGEEDE